jgi:ZIP family zinc transporter
MADTERTRAGVAGVAGDRLGLALGVVVALAFAGVLAGGYTAGREKLVGIVLFAFLAMAAGVALQQRTRTVTGLSRVWIHGLASGAMLASATALLAPKAITQHPEIGGFAVAFGYLLGYAGHELGHVVSHWNLPLNVTVGELTLHALLAGAVMGVVYGTLPSLTALFGYGIVAHKLPAGFSGAETLDRDELSVFVMVLPAAAVGFAAVPLSLATPALGTTSKAVFYGVSTGLFAHVALDMIPECGGGGPSHGYGDLDCGPDVDRQRYAAVASTLAGALVLFALWVAVA